MEELKKRLLEKLKKIKSIKDSQSEDAALFALEKAVYEVLNYCHLNIEEWPIGLDTTAVLMTIDILDDITFSLDLASEGEVRSLSEGDFSIAKETKAEAYQKIKQVPSFAKDYARTLHSFRRLTR